MSVRRHILQLIVGVVLVVPTELHAKEARPPKWSNDVLDTFFEDAREKLAGPRPDYGAHNRPHDSSEASPLQRASDPGSFAWSQLIDPGTLETEVKRLSQSLSRAVTSLSQFKGGGYKDARRDFSELAILFAVTAQYDGKARWKDAAAGLRELFSRAAANAKVGSDETYRAATAGKQDLADLVRGSRPSVPTAEAAVTDWSQVAARPPLMQRMNVAHQERLTKWLADPATFRRNQNDVRHEAQIVALLAEVVHREAFEYWDDETFAGFADELRQAENEIAAADDYSQARKALGRATSACANCHDGYRG